VVEYTPRDKKAIGEMKALYDAMFDIVATPE
jgi:hypothetical protein